MRIFVSTGGGGHTAGFGNGGREASRGQISGAYLSVLGRFGVVETASPAAGVRHASRTGGLHLCFALPLELPREAGFETVPVFGLGTAECPDATFGSSKEWTSWTARLAQAGRAVCFSKHAQAAVRARMGLDFPCYAVPPPLTCSIGPEVRRTLPLQSGKPVLDTALWDDTAPVDALPPLGDMIDLPDDEGLAFGPHAIDPPAELAFPERPWRKTPRYRLGTIRLHGTAIYREAVSDLLPEAMRRVVSKGARAARTGLVNILARREAGQVASFAGDDSVPGWSSAPVMLSGDGLVFAAVHGAWDRSWVDLLSAFIATCRSDSRVTLVIATDGMDSAKRAGCAGTLRRLGPFACRVVILNGGIEGGLDRLIEASNFYVCASHSEATPLPTMRFMMAGRPCVAPSHSALADFIEPASSFVVASGLEYEAFPGDVQERLAATGWRLDWESLCRGIGDAVTLAHAPDQYRARAVQAARTMAGLCDPDAVHAALAPLMAQFQAAPARSARRAVSNVAA